MKETINTLISEEDIKNRVKAIAEQIDIDYHGKAVTLICILTGSIMFTVDLARELKTPVEFDFMSVSSYGDATTSSGHVKINKDLSNSITGKDVILVEDIIDSGRTLHHLLPFLNSKNPNSLKLCTLLDKPEKREYNVDVDYVGFEIPDYFIVGYGLDYAQKYRNLPYIGILNLE